MPSLGSSGVAGLVTGVAKITHCVVIHGSRRSNMSMRRMTCVATADNGDISLTGFGVAHDDRAWQAWLNQQAGSIQEQAAVEAKEAALAAEAGVHIRGTETRFEDVNTDEDDKRRHYWHRQLHGHAEKGDYVAAEEVLKGMRKAKFPPGPRAFHALVYSYVRGGNSAGALKAIKEEAAKGITPLPQTYAAIIYGFLAEGDLRSADRMYASHRRAGISFEKSWTALCAALFNAEEYQRADEVLKQGESEGMIPDKRLYEAIIKTHARRGQISEALRRLQEMRLKHLIPDKDHFSALVTANALAGSLQAAEILLGQMLKAPGVPTASTMGAVNALLQTYLDQNLPPAELASKITCVRQAMVRGGLELDRKGLSLLLEAAVCMNKPEMGNLAFVSLKGLHGIGSLQYVADEVLASFLLQLSTERLTPDLYELLNVMSLEGRRLAPEMMLQGQDGRTFLTAWMHDAHNIGGGHHAENKRPLQSEGSSEDTSEPQMQIEQPIVIDDVTLDSRTLCAIDNKDKPLMPGKMSVKELRAELVARQYGNLRGNKRELVKKVQKARAEANVAGASIDDNKAGRSKVGVVLEEETYVNGQLVQKNVSENERDVGQDDGDEEDNGEDQEEAEDELYDGSATIKQADVDDDDTDEVDYDGRIGDILQARRKFKEPMPRFQDVETGVEQALVLFRGVIAMGGAPSNADIAVIVRAVVQSNDGSTYAKQLLSILSDEGMGGAVSVEERQALDQLMN